MTRGRQVLTPSLTKVLIIALGIAFITILITNPFGIKLTSEDQQPILIDTSSKVPPTVKTLVKTEHKYITQNVNPAEQAENLRRRSDRCGAEKCGKHGNCFLYKCFCDPGYTGQYCEQVDARTKPGECRESIWDDSCFFSEAYGVPKVDHARWLKASSGELNEWVTKITLSDDRGDEHTTGFSKYAAVPFFIGDIIEVGCGPFTQLRNMVNQQPRNYSSVTLLDPLLLHYFKGVPNCAYKSGIFMHFEYTTFIQAGGEALNNIHEAYDTLIMMNVIEHVENVYHVLENIYNALRPGGYMIIHERWWPKFHPHHKNYILDGYKREHPVRIKEVIWTHFKSYFQVVYDIPSINKKQIDTSIAMAEPEEVGSYTIARKLTLPEIEEVRKGIALKKFGSDADDLVFHLLWSDSTISTIDSIISRHGNAALRIKVYTDSTDASSKLASYSSVTVVPKNLVKLSESTAIQEWSKKFVTDNESVQKYLDQILILAALYKEGGVHIPDGNRVTRDLRYFRNIYSPDFFLKFNKGHPFLNFAISALQFSDLKVTSVNEVIKNRVVLWEKASSKLVVHQRSSSMEPERDLDQVSSLYYWEAPVRELI